MGGGRPRAQLTSKLHEFARQAVQQALAGLNVMEHATAEGGAQANAELRSGLAAATPALLEFGGTRQLLTVVPRNAVNVLTSAVLSKALNAAVTTTLGCDNNLALCVEAGDLSVQHIAASFVEYRRDRVEFAGRVHCRTDVSWTPLIDTTASAEPVVWPDMNASQVQSRDAMCKTLVM
jgi:hypothetical protein